MSGPHNERSRPGRGGSDNADSSGVRGENITTGPEVQPGRIYHITGDQLDATLSRQKGLTFLFHLDDAGRMAPVATVVDSDSPEVAYAVPMANLPRLCALWRAAGHYTEPGRLEGVLQLHAAWQAEQSGFGGRA